MRARAAAGPSGPRSPRIRLTEARLPWTLLAAVAFGLLLGRRYRVGAVIVATAVVLALALAIGLALRWSAGEVSVAALLHGTAVQAGYLIALWLGVARRRPRPQPDRRG